MGRMDGKVAVVTGAGGGLCAATAKMFAKEGAKVVLVDRKDAVHDHTAEIVKAGGDAVALQLDVGVRENWDIIYKTVMDTYGTCTTVVNGAADFPLAGDWNTCKDVDAYLENWDIEWQSNVMALVYSVLAFMPDFIKAEEECSYLNFSSVTAYSYTGAGCQAYPATKAAIKIITADMAAKHSKDGVRFNSVAPNNVATPDNANIFGPYHDKFVADTPLGRLGEADEVAYVATFLCSDEASFVTGECIVIDGGFLTCH